MEVKIATKSGLKTGTSTAAYVEVFRADTRGYGIQGSGKAMIKNSGASWDLNAKVLGYLADVDGTLSGQYDTIQAECVIAQAAASTVTWTIGYAAVVISVKSSESTATTWQVDYTTY
jgi:hypothetical protein